MTESIENFDGQMASLRTPPHSIEAEQSVLGGLLLDNSAWDKIADVISEADFYRHDHRLIYKHIARLVELARPADVVTVSESLDKNAELGNVGGLAYLATLAQNTTASGLSPLQWKIGASIIFATSEG